MIWHIIPENDTRGHLMSRDCPCKPVSDFAGSGTDIEDQVKEDVVYTHNAFELIGSFDILNNNFSDEN